METETSSGEIFVMIFESGPFPERFDVSGLDWPLPDRVKAEGHGTGYYEKVYESKGEPAHSGEAKGARYEWREDGIYDPRRDGI